MIRFRRLLDANTVQDKLRLAKVNEIYQKAFPDDQDYAEKIVGLIRNRAKLDYEVILLTAEGAKGRVLGFSLFFWFPRIRYAYLDHIASDPDRPGRGIGGSLYEATREVVSRKGGKGLFFDVPPDDPDRMCDLKFKEVNEKRMHFYERYGARPVIGTIYDTASLPNNEGCKVYLVYDPLGRKGELSRADLRKVIKRILHAKYHVEPDESLSKEIISSVKDDPAQIRPPRYTQKPVKFPPVSGKVKPVDLVIVSSEHRIHHLREKGYVERPVRIDTILEGLEGLPMLRHSVRRFGERAILEVHDRKMVEFLKEADEQLQPKTPFYPDVFPHRQKDRLPRNWQDQAGYFCNDTFTPITANTFKAARGAVNAALTGTNLLLEGSLCTYVLCRPPGHHAERRTFGGFCYFNNAAIAANRLSQHGKVALLDIDFHHGNGSQSLFYDRSDVLFISIHGHPDVSYPTFSGFADEKGIGDGKGFNFNYPLYPGVDNQKYLETLEKALGLVRKFSPDWLVVSLGLDIMRGDPTGSFFITPRGMQEIGKRICRLRLPILIVQEGGYSLGNLRKGSRLFFSGLLQCLY